MPSYDDIFSRTNRRQEEARQWENIRQRARAGGDSRAAQDAYINMMDIDGLPPHFWMGVRDRARGMGDSQMAEGARQKMNEGGPSSEPPFTPPGGGGWYRPF